MAEGDEPVIGIDLGTTYSCVAIFRHGKAEIIENQQGGRVTPSMVAFTQHDLLVGIAAMNQAATNPSNTISEVKRLVGRNFHDKSVQDDIKLWPFWVVEGKDGKPMIKVNHKGNDLQLTAEQISANVLSYLKEAAEKRLGREVKSAVVTVPAYFNDAQRCATRDAADIAGLNILRIINEPTAAALAYGLDKAFSGQVGKKNVLIFDLGGGTFDVTVLDIENNVMEVKSTLGDTHLGGADFDNRLVKHFVQELERRYGPEASSNPKVLRRLRANCEQTKRMLSSSNHATINVENLYDGNDFIAEISRARFENLNLDLFDKCIDLVEKCLEDANMDKHSVDDVVLVGGSSRIPKIQELLKDFFGRDILRNTINPDEAVACGAAIQAAMLTGNGIAVENWSTSRPTTGNSRSSGNQILRLRDVTPFSLGLEVTGEKMSVVIPRNTPIPFTKTEVFVNAYDKQKVVSFNVYEGERAIVTDNNLLGKFKISGFKPRSEGKVKFDTTFSIDANGILLVSAMERKSKISAAITITDDRGRLTVEERERMINEARAYRMEQKERAKVAEAKEELESFIYDLQSKMRSRSMKPKLDVSQRSLILGKIDEALEWSERNKSTATLSDYHNKKSALLNSWEALRVALQLPRD